MKKPQKFTALVLALSLETNIEAFEKEFNHDGVIEKGNTYDAEANATSFRYKDSNGITKPYTIDGEIPSKKVVAKIVEKKAVTKKVVVETIVAKKVVAKKSTKIK